MKSNLSSLNLNALIYFNEVARHENVTQAAKGLRISQPAVTKMIKQLEAQLGVTLFRKVGRKIELTDAGKQWFKSTSNWLAEIESDYNSLLRTQDKNSLLSREEHIKLGMSDHLAIYTFPKVIDSFSKSYKNVTWDVYTGTGSSIKEKIISNEIDLGFFYTKPSIKETRWLKEEKVADIDFAIVASPQAIKQLSGNKFKLEVKPSLELIRKFNIPYIGARNVDYLSQTAEHWIYRRAGLEPHLFIQTNTKEAQKSLTIRGLGFSVLPRLMVERELKSKVLIEFSAPKQSLVYELICVSRKSFFESPAVAEFKEKFAQAVSKN